MRSRNKNHRSGKRISRGGITEALSGRSMSQAEHHLGGTSSRLPLPVAKEEKHWPRAQTAQANTPDLS